MILLTAILATALAAVHLLIGRLGFLDSVPRSVWLSGAGGVAVAYVFLHLLPELAAHQKTVEEGLGLATELAEVTIFSVGLVGLTVFYGLERLAKASSQLPPRRSGAFWIHIGSFALYNALIGYLLVHPEVPGLASSLLFFAAMAMHFVTNDFGLRHHHKDRYDDTARWLLASAVLVGWLLGILADLPRVVIALLFAFLAGGVILNVLKEELPEDRQSRFLPFMVGAVGYSLVLVSSALV